MKLFQFALIVCLAVIFYPGVFFTLPKKGPFSTTCLMHALLFTCMFLAVNHLYYTYVSSDELLEGARDRHHRDRHHRDHHHIDHHHIDHHHIDHHHIDHHHIDHHHIDHEDHHPKVHHRGAHHHDHHDHRDHHHDHRGKIHELEKKERRAEHHHDEALVKKYKQEIRTYSDGKRGTPIEHAYGLLTPAPTTAAATTRAPTTGAPTTPAATTGAATTGAATTGAPTTRAPTTRAPTTGAPTTELVPMVDQSAANTGLIIFNANPNSPGPEVYQSFTAKQACKLKKIIFFPNAVFDVTTTIIIREGEGITGPRMYTGTWNMNAPTTSTNLVFDNFSDDVNLTKGQKYSIQLTDFANETSLELLVKNNDKTTNNGYSGGHFYVSVGDRGVFGNLKMQIWVEPESES